VNERRGAVLLIDVEPEVRETVGSAAAALGLDLQSAHSLTAGLRALSERQWAATFLSMDLPGVDLSLARRIAAETRAGMLVLIAAVPSVELAMEATGAGASELLARSVEPQEVLHVLRGAITGIRGVPLPDVASAVDEELIGGSAALLEVFKMVGRIASSPATVLVTGESGTGKELVARALHRMSTRRERPFVAVNCAAIPEDLLESELFGHERGAFTGAVARKIGRFERAHGGTLFLDEIGDMSLVLQAKILRALQEREIERLGGEERIPVDVRVVAATHRDLSALIRVEEFREDLYYRLAVVRLPLPPLRERANDVSSLALHFAARFARAYGRPLRAISKEALEILADHSWPGNVRELRNVLERAVLLASGEVLLPEHIALERPQEGPTPGSELLPGYASTLSMAEVEALHIARVLQQVDGHYGRAAEILGMHRNTVSRKALEAGIVEA
jgi:two-component system response regulator PilR (NtrC family)